MRKAIGFLALALTIAAAPVFGADDTLHFNSGLTTSSGVGALGGFGNFFMDLTGNQATVHSSATGLGTITGVFLYQGNQPLLAFNDNQTTFRFGQFARTVTLDPALASAIAANPQNYSIVITTLDQPLGALRGQLNDANTRTLTGSLGDNGAFTMELRPRPGGNDYDLDLDMTTRGIGNAISSLAITQVSSIQPLVNLDFSNSAVVSNGRFTGSTTIGAGLARQILANPSGYMLNVNTPAATGAAAGTLSVANELFIPVVGTVRGLNNTNWKTSLNILNGNAGDTSTTAMVQFFPSSAPGITVAQNATSMTLPANSMANAPDISGSLFPGLEGIGAMRIVTAGNVFANARIFNDLTGSARGTFGQSVPALTRSRALSQGVLVGLSDATQFRTNVGLFNPNEVPADVELELRDATGAVKATRIVTIPAMTLSQVPLSTLFGTTSASANASVTFLAGAPMFVFGSVVDNDSGDATFVEAQNTQM